MGINFKRKSEEPAMTDRTTMPMVPVARRRAEIGQQAAAHAQEWIDLHAENDQLNQQYNSALNRIALLESHVASLQAELANMTFERDDYKHKFSEIDISLRNAGSILCGLLRIPREVEARRDGENEGRVNSAIREMERNLSEQQGAPNPS